jgi:pimeloyl-ACP methyl ester carboxylesterase
MATIVAVHGAMHGGWAWSPVRRLLAGEGHEVYAPTLTGQGDRTHLLTREVGVRTHLADLVALLDCEDLHDVMLVLHSYAGVLAGPLVARRPERVSSVVLAGGFHARPGYWKSIEAKSTAATSEALTAESICLTTSGGKS